MYTEIKNKTKSISVIGLGYVGLPIALEFAHKFKVVGFDISEKRIQMMKNKIDPSKELGSSAFENADILFTSNLEDLKQASFHVVAVPTPIDRNKLPDLTPLIKSSETVGKIIKKGDYVVFESTVYPGATEEVCVPIIERLSGLKFNLDFKVGYSPERINPGDAVHTLTNVVKVVSGCDAESLENITLVYESIIKAGVHRASSIKVAEAAKVIENTQRDLNIALMNELSIIFRKIGINTFEVLEAAGTKWNFLKFFPGLVGGHCIGVDPYYLTFKANQLGHFAQVITAGRSVNDGMSKFMVTELVKEMIKAGKNISESKVLVMGVTFKEDVSDIRNSKVADVIKELLSYGMQVDVVDPHADPEEVKEEYGIDMVSDYTNDYDSVIVAVSHKEYLAMTESDFNKIINNSGFLYDVKGIFRNRIKGINYLSL
ncbi:MAG: nucleotide sugar dehydrogenase [Bacteroidales bacterium]|nr:nucleotide sugar dehydrogenase [Bacteroidales bacterium]MBN2820607.1 nucleotide sugar dehydrogenase [Bacteroidales bacterium]